MKLIVKRADQTLSEQTFEDDFTIGSQADCELCLEGPDVGGLVARIALDGDDQWRVESLDPDSPVLLNDAPLTERRKLVNNDVLAVGSYEIHVNFADEEEESASDEPPLSPEELAKIKQYPLPPNAVVKRHYEALNLSPEQLERVARMAVHLGACRDVHELVDAALTMLMEAFSARMAWIGVRRKPVGELEVVAGRTPSGHTTASTPVLDLLQYRCLERAQHICVRKIVQGDISTAIAVPLRTTAGNLGVIYIDRRRGAKRFQIIDLDILSALAGHVAAKLDAMFQARQQQSAIQSAAEIALVHSIQTLLDPKGAPAWRNLQLAAYGRSGQDNPGDVYDIMTHPDTNMSAIMLGHVISKGASLALAMARLHSTFRVGFLHMDPPHALARTLNWLMYDEKDPANVDALFLVIDPATGKFRYTRAGRIGGFIVNTRGEPRLVSGADGPSMGRIRNYEYISKIDQLAPGETLALYTRGVATAVNAAGERFSEKRFIDLVCDGFGQRPSQTIQDITDELTSFFNGGKHPDDISIVLLHHLPGGQ
ncbi:MAG TPA: SpoIIE family protein phosphatase [Phycisphaerae bacterium]|nr:SpoIIE family protein phosphatase [Phycisphaerae bacterium]HOJ76216.1 SpoIIE family protein phosphatase [Phycisphaerae bacterium]HOM53572.1 SpoIIE family protein phosphatase [Phycisphaerae bacterium]HON66541.1 SpoIIE family protein phosphatase [Phycisphaerae bacterium]HOQ84545.1 SpoIIE family protein phosphatase [Phycisphaerae bacterium]